MKKLLALFLVLLMMVSLLACAAKAPTSAPEEPKAEEPKAEEPAKEEPKAEKPAEEEPAAAEGLPYEGVTLKYWTAPESERAMAITKEMIAAFKEETGASVEVSYVPWGEFNTKFISGFMSGDGPDVLYTTPDNIGDMINAELLVDLNDYFTAEEQAERVAWASANINGGQYGMPYWVEYYGRGYFFNMDMLEAAGVTEAPDTYDELVDACLKIKEAGICEYPLMITGNGGTEAVLETFAPMLYSNGGSILNADGTAPTLNSDAALQAAQYLNDLIYKYEVLSTDCLSYDYTQVGSLFRDQKAAIVTGIINMIQDQDSFFSVTDESGKTTAYDRFAIDVNCGMSDGEHPVMVNMNYDMMSVSAVSENIDAAIAWLKFLSQEDWMAQMIGGGASRSNLYVTSPKPEFKYDYLKKAAEHVATPGTTFSTPVCTGAGTIWESLFTNFQMLLLNQLTPQQCVDAMQAAAEAAMAD